MVRAGTRYALCGAAFPTGAEVQERAGLEPVEVVAVEPERVVRLLEHLSREGDVLVLRQPHLEDVG